MKHGVDATSSARFGRFGAKALASLFNFRDEPMATTVRCRRNGPDAAVADLRRVAPDGSSMPEHRCLF